MQISKKADYAIRAVTILATLGPERTLQAQELASMGQIPTKFLEQILLVLKRAGILRSKRGVGGGYRLGKESRLISVGDVIEAVDGELVQLHDPTEFPSFTGASGIAKCLGDAENAVNDQLRKTTIEEVVEHGEGDSMVGYGI